MSVACRPALLPVAFRLALRDLKGGFRGFRIFIACLLLGVAAIAGVGSLTAAVVQGLQQEGQSLLGGDIELRLTQHQATDAQLEFLNRAGIVSETRSLRAMARHLSNDERSLAEVKGVDDLYPLYGAVTLDGAATLDEALGLRDGRWGVAIAPELGYRMAARVGDELKIGDVVFAVRAILQREPDRANEGLELAPRAMVAAAALDATGLLREGSISYVSYRIKLPPDTDVSAFSTTLQERFPDAGWRIRDREGSAPRLREFAERVGLFLTLVGLTTLVVGGVGVGGAVRSYLNSRSDSIATLKVLGATSGMIMSIYLLQILLVSLVAIAAGTVLGATTPFLAGGVLVDKLPVPPQGAIYPLPLIQAVIYGILIVLVFSLPPLARARAVPAAALFRRLVSGGGGRLSAATYGVMAAIAALLLALPHLGTDNNLFVAGVEAAVLGVLAVLIAAGAAIRAIAARLPRPKNPAFRLALANLHRPGAPTVGIVLALGLGLTLFVTLALIEGNLRHQIAKNLPEEAPAFFFLDIQRDQIDAFRSAAGTVDGVNKVTVVPYLRGQITAINGVPAGEVDAAPDARWVLRGDRGLTFATSLPADNRLRAGQWWPEDYAGPPQISFDHELAAGLGGGIGSRMTITVLGREIEAEIASLREIDWGTLGINFAIMFDPFTLSGAPFGYLATLHADEAAEARAYRLLTDAFPNVSAVRMKEVLGEIARIVGDMGAAVRVAAVITVLAGILVLAGATAAGLRERTYDSILLKILGGTRGTVMLVLVTEYLILGLATGLLAAGLGIAAAYVVATHVMNLDWLFLPQAVLLTVMISVALTVALGLLGTWSALTARPAPALRAYAA